MTGPVECSSSSIGCSCFSAIGCSSFSNWTKYSATHRSIIVAVRARLRPRAIQSSGHTAATLRVSWGLETGSRDGRRPRRRCCSCIDGGSTPAFVRPLSSAGNRIAPRSGADLRSSWRCGSAFRAKFPLASATASFSSRHVAGPGGPLPPHHEVGGLCAERRQHEHGGEDDSAELHAIASRFGCSQLDPAGRIRQGPTGRPSTNPLLEPAVGSTKLTLGNLPPGPSQKRTFVRQTPTQPSKQGIARSLQGLKIPSHIQRLILDKFAEF
jgi:hypothetical protein